MLIFWVVALLLYAYFLAAGLNKHLVLPCFGGRLQSYHDKIIEVVKDYQLEAWLFFLWLVLYAAVDVMRYFGEPLPPWFQRFGLFYVLSLIVFFTRSYMRFEKNLNAMAYSAAWFLLLCGIWGYLVQVCAKNAAVDLALLSSLFVIACVGIMYAQLLQRFKAQDYAGFFGMVTALLIVLFFPYTYFGAYHIARLGVTAPVENILFYDWGVGLYFVHQSSFDFLHGLFNKFLDATLLAILVSYMAVYWVNKRKTRKSGVKK